MITLHVHECLNEPVVNNVVEVAQQGQLWSIVACGIRVEVHNNIVLKPFHFITLCKIILPRTHALDDGVHHADYVADQLQNIEIINKSSSRIRNSNLCWVNLCDGEMLPNEDNNPASVMVQP